MKQSVVVCLLVLAPAAYAQSTRNNDDSCDISVTPAATLLIPWFEVDVTSPSSRAATTIFTIINTSVSPQIASATIWTDRGFALFTFDIVLTGYDVASINLRDVLVDGVLPANRPRACLPPGGRILADTLADIRAALTTGASVLCPNDRIGEAHAKAMGYITIDVVAACAETLPTDESYYTRELLFDNVLIGDYAYLVPDAFIGNLAGATPMVHIRAVPEGGSAGEFVDTNLPYTFYDRYTPRTQRRFDRRQPLPSVFAARYIQGGTSGFATDFLIWREGVNGATAACDKWIDESTIPFVEQVRFDDRANPTTLQVSCPFTCRPFIPSLPLLSRRPTSASIFPALTSGDVAGWMYMNLSNNGSSAYSVAAGRDFRVAGTGNGPRPSQNWVVRLLSAEGRFAVLMESAMLGNGCSPARPVTAPTAASTIPIGPLPNVNP